MINRAFSFSAQLIETRVRQLHRSQQFTRHERYIPCGLPRYLCRLNFLSLSNDRIDIAFACGAEGLHLGQSDLPLDKARRLLPPNVFIGWSVASMSDVLQSATLPVDYLGVSPIFATLTKTDTKNAWGLDGLAGVARRYPIALGSPLGAFMRAVHVKCCEQVLTALLS